MQFPRTTPLSTPLQPPPTPTPQPATGAPSLAPANTTVGTGATSGSLQSDRHSFALSILHMQATKLYQATLDEAPFRISPPPLPSVDSMKELLQELEVLNQAPQPHASSPYLFQALTNYGSLAETAAKTTSTLVFMQHACGLSTDNDGQASLLSFYHASCQNVAWEMCQASVHYAFQAHYLCNLSEDATAAEMKLPLASQHPGDRDSLHQLLVERKQLGIQLIGLALMLMAQHQHWGEVLCSKPRDYSRIPTQQLREAAALHFRVLHDLETKLQTYAATPARAFVQTIFDAADTDLSKVSGSLEDLANDRLFTYEVDAIAVNSKMTSDLRQSYATWHTISSEQRYLPENETRSRILCLEIEMCMNVDKVIESMKSQMSYFFESRLNTTSFADKQAEQELLESYARLHDFQSERRDAATAMTKLSTLKPLILSSHRP
ncbi:hypothetical protein [Ottowia thiooxydans]|uniref:BRO1 domain-containing protein n=1 Tax=Ottowia thiooxydans TaxID=219182 RepID=A0ABV2Q7A1_9BURK